MDERKEKERERKNKKYTWAKGLPSGDGGWNASSCP